MEAGIYKDIPIDEYHGSEGISSSGISLLLDCPKRYHFEYLDKDKPLLTREEQEKIELKYLRGRVFHTLVLEPHKFEQEFYPMTEKISLATNVGKEKMAIAVENAQGRQVIRAGILDDVYAMAAAAIKHPVWQRVKNGSIENSIYWDTGIYNTRLRSRPDIFDDTFIIDLKTTRSVKDFSRSIYAYGYHRQAAMQVDALEFFTGKRRFFAFFCVETVPPYLTACYTLDELSLQQGRREYLDAAALYSECLQFDDWPGYDEKFQLISIPKWAQKEV